MPCATDYILDGLARNLELERELGSYSLEFDREFLAQLPKERSVVAPVVEKPAELTERVFDFVFLHHAPLVGPGVEMMAKIVAAMKRTPESAPFVFAGSKPAAKVHIVLGVKALAQWYPGEVQSFGCWFKDADSEVLVVASPEDIYRFGTALTPTMVQKKREMWNSLKEVLGKFGG